VKNIAQKSNKPSSETLVHVSVTAISFGPLCAIRTHFVLDRLTQAIVVNKVITNCATGTPILHVEASFISVERGLRQGILSRTSLKHYIHFSFILKLVIFIYKQLKRHIAFSVVQLSQTDFRADMCMCYFPQHNLECLGYQLTCEGIQPQSKKVETICRLRAPKSRMQLWHFLGVVNYIRNMWQRRSHILAPLTKLSSKAVPFKWGVTEQKAVEELKPMRSLTKNLCWPSLNLTSFSTSVWIYTHASDYQLVAVIPQEGKPLASCNCKMNKAQQNCTTDKNELLLIAETLKEFRNILLGQKVITTQITKTLCMEISQMNAL